MGAATSKKSACNDREDDKNSKIYKILPEVKERPDTNFDGVCYAQDKKVGKHGTWIVSTGLGKSRFTVHLKDSLRKRASKQTERSLRQAFDMAVFFRKRMGVLFGLGSKRKTAQIESKENLLQRKRQREEPASKMVEEIFKIYRDPKPVQTYVNPLKRFEK